MTQTLRPYPDYRSCGQWFGRVPEHWATPRLRNLFRVLNGATPPSGDPANWDGEIVWITPDDLGRISGRSIATSRRRITDAGYKSCGTSLAPPGSVAISTRAPIGHLAITSVPACVNQGCRLLVPTDGSSSHYWYYLLVSAKPELQSLGEGTTFSELSRGKLRDAVLTRPPLAEQRAIVRFLRHMDSRINRLIRAKRRLIALLNEQKHAIIHRAVTRGLDPNVRLKPSGIPWLDDIPQHWGVLRSRRLFSVRKDLALPDDLQLSATQAYGVIPQSEFEQKVGRRVVKISMHLEKRRHVEKDDFVISMRSFQGGLERAWVSGCIRSSYVVLKPGSDADVGFFAYLFKSHGYIRALQATADFIRDGQDLNFSNFCLVDLPVVPLKEQKAIAEFLDSTAASIDTPINRARVELELLREYRTRLIADVVTGKLDVCGVKLPSLDEDEPLNSWDEGAKEEEADEVAETEEIALADV